MPYEGRLQSTYALPIGDAKGVSAVGTGRLRLTGSHRSRCWNMHTDGSSSGVIGIGAIVG